MLGKLLKYELKSTSRIMGVLYLALLVVVAVVGFVARGTIWEATQGNAIAVVISGLIYTLLVMALLIITIVMVLQRFYKNLLKEEGYLMHTLPVPTWMLVASKTICSLIWILLSIAVFARICICNFPDEYDRTWIRSCRLECPSSGRCIWIVSTERRKRVYDDFDRNCPDYSHDSAGLYSDGDRCRSKAS